MHGFLPMAKSQKYHHNTNKVHFQAAVHVWYVGFKLMQAMVTAIASTQNMISFDSAIPVLQCMVINTSAKPWHYKFDWMLAVQE